MANEGKRKVQTRTTPKYTIFDDEGDSSDNEEDFSLLFKDLSFKQIEKINELLTSINEKDGVLECQEDLLVKENEKFVKLKDALAHEKENSRI
jgi:hypothetical protein